MALLWPRIGEKDVNAARAPPAGSFTQDLDRIMLDDAYVGEIALGDGFQQAANARRMHLDPEIVVFGMLGGNRSGRFAHAKTDLHELGCDAAKQCVEIQSCAE